MLARINQAIDHYEPTIRLLYRIGVMLAIVYGMTYIGDRLYIDAPPVGEDAACQSEAPRFSS